MWAPEESKSLIKQHLSAGAKENQLLTPSRPQLTYSKTSLICNTLNYCTICHERSSLYFTVAYQYFTDIITPWNHLLSQQIPSRNALTAWVCAIYDKHGELQRKGARNICLISQLQYPEKSALAEHVLSTGHKPDFQDSRILPKAAAFWDRGIVKAIEINLDPSTLNGDVKMQLSACWRCVLKLIAS